MYVIPLVFIMLTFSSWEWDSFSPSSWVDGNSQNPLFDIINSHGMGWTTMNYVSQYMQYNITSYHIISCYIISRHIKLVFGHIAIDIPMLFPSWLVKSKIPFIIQIPLDHWWHPHGKPILFPQENHPHMVDVPLLQHIKIRSPQGKPYMNHGMLAPFTESDHGENWNRKPIIHYKLLCNWIMFLQIVDGCWW